MSYCGIYIKENATLEDFQEVIESYYQGLLSMRRKMEDIRIQNEKYREEYEKRRLEFGDNDERSGITCVSTSVNLIDYVRHMISQSRYRQPGVKYPDNWIEMWREKFKNEPEILDSVWM